MLLVVLTVLGSGWELIDEDGPLKVWTRDKAGSDYEEIRARIEIAASFERTWTVLDDVERYVEFMPRLVEARVLERIGRIVYQYQKIDPPVLAARDSVMRIEVERSERRGSRRFSAATHPSAPAVSDGTVRLLVFAGEWRVEALETGKTALTYQVHAEPGGSIPSWLANYASTVTIPRLMNAFRERLES
ncbi:MAG: START domain-containing protein [Myxococcota bacterium]